MKDNGEWINFKIEHKIYKTQVDKIFFYVCC